jgi:glucose/arabinose dehydrogenase
MLATEVAGRLRLIHKDGKLEPEPVAGLPLGLRGGSFGGLMDIALHPKFAENQWVYFAYTKAGEPDATNTALAVFRGRWDGTKLVDVKDIFVTEPHAGGRDAPQPTRCCGEGPLDASYGSRITFDKDGFLYVTSGDRNWGEQAQVPNSDLGKILRLKDDGSIPADNPFVGKEGYRGEIYTTGHRNPLGLTYDPVTGRIWSTEFGPRGGDELNLIEKGKNYGWLLVTNGTHYDAARAGGAAGGSSGKNNVAGFVDPTLWWGPECNETTPACGGNGGANSSFSPGNVAVYNGDKFPAWKGNLLIGVMGAFSGTGGTGQPVRTFVLRVVVDDKGKFVSQTPIITGLGQRIRDVRVGPDAYVYLLTDTGAILRVEPGK